jgi:hypothetical protein
MVRLTGETSNYFWGELERWEATISQQKPQLIPKQSNFFVPSYVRIGAKADIRPMS